MDASWVIVRKVDGTTLFETFNKQIADNLNSDYYAMPIEEYLQTLNKRIATYSLRRAERV